MDSLFRVLINLNSAVAWLVFPLAVWILISGLDDLVVDAAALCAWISRRRKPAVTKEQLRSEPEQAIAIFIPCWHESSVIARMVQQNAHAIAYSNYRIFIGAYPNDPATIEVVHALENRYEHVHLAMCPHDGPTSKADCLNWTYQRMLQYERENSERFVLVITHDAEDVIHAASLRWINFYSRNHEMVQVPVLPLPTPLRKWTHAVYCDEFTEYQSRDMPARHWMGAFVPSTGVGTGFRRDALENLAASEGNRIFEPSCLTEDYENGFRLKLLGARQMFVPVQQQGVATREYFPQSYRTAVRQRTRWITGISLQTWDRHGWKGTLVQKYWLWRDRKGLIGNPLSLVTNAIFGYGLASYSVSVVTGHAWALQGRTVDLAPLFLCVSVLGLWRLAYRAVCVGRHYGWRFALSLPFRSPYANLINAVSTFRAVCGFSRSKWRKQPLNWVKTEHEYPSQAALGPTGRRLGDVLLGNGYVNYEQLCAALQMHEPALRLGERLMSLGHLSEPDLYEALSLQQGLPQICIDPRMVRVWVARGLPARVVRQWRVVPFGVEFGALLIAGPDAPTEQMRIDLRRFTALDLRFHLITPDNFQELVNTLL